MATMARDSKGRFTKDNGRSGKTSLGVIGAAAAGGAALGLLAMFGRKAAVQAPSALAGGWDAALALEHKAIRKLFDALEATDESATVRRNLHLAQLKHVLAKHDLEEGNVIYPALREAGMTQAADELTKEHGYVKQHLYELENSPSNSPQWMETVRAFRAEIEAHMEEEENELFPRLRARLPDEKNKSLTIAMNKEGFKLA